MNRKGKLIILSGPSGVGKGTVRMALMKNPNLHLFYSVSMTTRSPRPGEVNGREYYFVSKEEFQRNIDSGNLLEWAEFVGNRYGTPKDKVDAMLESGKNVLLEIEVDVRGHATDVRIITSSGFREMDAAATAAAANSFRGTVNSSSARKKQPQSSFSAHSGCRFFAELNKGIPNAAP